MDILIMSVEVYSKGYFYLDSLEEEPADLIIEKTEK